MHVSSLSAPDTYVPSGTREKTDEACFEPATLMRCCKAFVYTYMHTYVHTYTHIGIYMCTQNSVDMYVLTYLSTFTHAYWLAP